jgi:hypothetical protein
MRRKPPALIAPQTTGAPGSITLFPGRRCFGQMGKATMQQRWAVLAFASLAFVMTCPVDAAAKKPPAKKSAKPASKPAAKPVVEPAKTPGGFMVPKETLLVSPTPAEREANAVWSIRAGLNVAALQCQFSKYLRTAQNYNAFIKHHADELNNAATTLNAHFKRTAGARAAASFDQFNTKLYNSYSTLDAQYAFCDAAGRVGREVLAVPKDALGPLALRLYPEMRLALSQQPLSPGLRHTTMEPFVLPPIVALED